MYKQKIVVDTNVFIAALLSATGTSRLMIRACLKSTFQPLMGMALFTEYEDIMARNALFTTCVLNATERNKLFNAFLSVCEWKNIYYLWRPNLQDEADNHIVELGQLPKINIP